MQRARDRVGRCPIGSLAGELADLDPDARMTRMRCDTAAQESVLAAVIATVAGYEAG